MTGKIIGYFFGKAWEYSEEDKRFKSGLFVILMFIVGAILLPFWLVEYYILSRKSK
jgi:membrane protein DedA with SNARE-associated domain